MKKFVSLLLTAVFCLTFVMPGFAEEGTLQNVPEKLEKIEKFLYGTEQAGALVTRIDNVETDMFGKTTSGAILNRVDNIYDAVAGSPASGLSLATKLNAVEWQFASRMSTGPAKTRIEDLEKSLLGTSDLKLPLTTRIDKLTAAAFPSGSITSSKATLPKDSLVKVKFMQEISSKTSKKGDEIDFIVDDNVYVGETLVLPKGAKGYGTIKKVVPARSFGRDARIDLDFSHVVAIDGSHVPVYVGELAKQQAKTVAGAAGASIGGMVLFGPVGIVGGAFVKGQSVTIPAGSNTFVQVTKDSTVNGIVQAGAATTNPTTTAAVSTTAGQTIATADTGAAEASTDTKTTSTNAASTKTAETEKTTTPTVEKK